MSVKTFIAYSHRDREFVDRLQTHLLLLKREGVIDTWFDRELPVGAEWAAEIDSHLKAADLILLLVSADFLASDYCYDIELKRALAMHDAGEAVVVPIILRPCDWHSAPFGKLQVLPRDGKPITSYQNIDEAFVETARELRRIASSVEPSEGLRPEQTMRIHIDADFDSYSEEQQKALLAAIRNLLDPNQNITIIAKRPGSVIIRLKLPRAEVERLQRAASDGELGDHHVVEAKVLVDDDTQGTLDSEASPRPKVFIGSSVEGLEIAETIQLSLDHICEVTIWSQGLFSLGRGTLETLTASLDKFD